MVEQYNSNYAVRQGGSEGVDYAALILGARRGQAQVYEWDGLRFAFGTNNPDFQTYFSDFFGVIADPGPSEWTQDLASTGTSTVADSEMLLTTAASASDHTSMALGLHWTVQNGLLTFSARFKYDSIAAGAFEVGLSDATSETAGRAFSDHSTPTAVATDAIVLCFDGGATSTIVVNAVNGGGTPQQLDTDVTPVNDTYVQFDFVVLSTGDLVVYNDGTLVGRIADAVAVDAPLTPWLSVESAGAAEVLSVDYLGVSSPRG